MHVPDGSFTPESPERKIGKTADLACGYMGGRRRDREVCAGYLTKLAQTKLL
jgi:hypothetical protein